jgi:hypothetical protein
MTAAAMTGADVLRADRCLTGVGAGDGCRYVDSVGQVGKRDEKVPDRGLSATPARPAPTAAWTSGLLSPVMGSPNIGGKSYASGVNSDNGLVSDNPVISQLPSAGITVILAASGPAVFASERWNCHSLVTAFCAAVTVITPPHDL